MKNGHPKISRELNVRLGRLDPRAKVRATVILRASVAGARAQRPTRTERQAAAKLLMKAAEAALPQIDRILERFDGHRIGERPDALGAIQVETTPDGVKALAASDCVKAILENQKIFPL
jgi:hypothetical protein